MSEPVKQPVESQSQIVEYNQFETKLAEFKKKYAGVVYDLDDEDQMKQARSDKLEIGRVVSRLDQIHDDIKAPLKERVDLIDGERKRIKDQLLDVQEGIKNQIKAHEQKKAEHEAKLQAMVDKFDLTPVMEALNGSSADGLKNYLRGLEAINVDDSYEHRKADATLAQIEAVKKLAVMIEEAEKREAEQAELERLRKAEAERAQKEREAQIAREAEEKAKREAEERHKRELEASERARIQAEEARKREAEAAEQARIKAEQDAKRQAEEAARAERERIEREQREAAEKAEKARQAEEAKKAKQAHRQKIHKEAKAGFIAAGLDDITATKVVELIKDSKIEHVQIIY